MMRIEEVQTKLYHQHQNQHSLASTRLEKIVILYSHQYIFSTNSLETWG